MIVLFFLLSVVIGYLCGSVPFGYIYVKLFTGINLTDYGSGRTGGTNSLRAAGLPIGVMTAFSDIFKGAVAVMLVRLLLGSRPDVLPWLEISAGIFAVVGHNWSLFLRFRGGAGTGPNVGWGMAVWWPMLPIGFVLMVGLLLTVGMASVASMSIALVIPAAFLLLYVVGISPYDSTVAYAVGGVITAVIVLWALRPNIKRLFEGHERIVGPRARRIQKRRSS